MSEFIKVFITKYALTRGIYESEGVIKKINGRNLFLYNNSLLFFNENEYFTSKEGAIKNARDRKKSKIKSLKRQITKLNKMKIAVNWQ